jgi:3-deoxy-D-manno-octulosonate 8-phosphate phosphatase (KDO 8-P phosphatase)
VSPVLSKSVRERARGVELLVLDVDGVLTDGGLYYGAEGEALKRFDVKDGHALVLAHLTGLRAAVLTARRSSIVEKRAAELWLSPVSQGNRDKRSGLFALLTEAGVSASRAGYVGDDVNDLPAMLEVGFAACPSDAAAEVKKAAHYVARARGGRGAVREIVEIILKAQGRWQRALDLMMFGASGRHPD